MKYGEGTIYQRKGSKTWIGELRIGTKPNGRPDIQRFSGKTKKSVKEQIERFKLNQSFVNKSLPAPCNQTAGEFAQLYIADYIMLWFKGTKVGKVKETTCDSIENTIKNHIIPSIGHIRLKDLTKQDISEKLVLKLIAGNLSYNTIQKAYNNLNSMYKFALKNHHVTFNPVDPELLPNEELFEKSEPETLNEDEIYLLKSSCTAVDSNNNYIFPLGWAFIFILNTGIRRGEALGLHWSDIDFLHKTARIRRNVIYATDRKDGQKKVMEKLTPKTKASNRTIPLNDTAIEALLKLKEIRYFGPTSNIIMTENKTLISPTNFSKTFKRIAKRVGLEKYGIHSLRHTFASVQFAKGTDVSIITKTLGHANEVVTRTIYIHIMQDMIMRAVQLANI